MRHLPRALNRFLLFVIGLVLIATGAGMLVAHYWSAAKGPFDQATSQFYEGYKNASDQSLVAIPGTAVQEYSWLAIAWISLAIIGVILLLVWIFSQGGGKVKELNLFGQKRKAHAGAANRWDEGEIVAQVGFVNALVQDAVANDRWIADVKTSAWDVKKQPGLLLSVIAYKGTDLKQLKATIDQVIARVDSVLGNPIPIMVHLTTNWRTTFQSADRVDNA